METSINLYTPIKSNWIKSRPWTFYEKSDSGLIAEAPFNFKTKRECAEFAEKWKAAIEK